jgi:hypothetical protein
MTFTTIQDYLIDLLQIIYNNNPNHEMFGDDLEEGPSLKAPYSSTRKNGTSWLNVIKSIANAKYLYPPSLLSNDCWMTKSSSIKLTKQKNGRIILVRSFKIVRFLAFLLHPSIENWIALRDGSIERPFDHLCQRGELADKLQKGYVCVNGINHGEFSNWVSNESRELCKNGALVLCPGHGFSKTFCIFTHPDGKIMPCRNHRRSVPSCKCTRDCYLKK